MIGRSERRRSSSAGSGHRPNVAYHAFSHPGDGVLVQPPVYFHFLNDPVMHGRALNDSPLVQRGDTYEIDLDDLERSVSHRTKIFLFCNPHNPVGRVYTRRELEKGCRDLPSP